MTNMIFYKSRCCDKLVRIKCEYTKRFTLKIGVKIFYRNSLPTYCYAEMDLIFNG